MYHDEPVSRRRPFQFRLADLLECVTVCAIVAAFSGAIGFLATGMLIGMALALGAKQGWLALTTMAAAIIAVDGFAVNSVAGNDWLAVMLILLLPGMLAAWYAWRSSGPAARMETWTAARTTRGQLDATSAARKISEA